MPGCCGRTPLTRVDLRILATGKVVRSAADSVCLSKQEESHAFFGRVNQRPDWTEGLQAWLARLHWGTKNCSGAVFGGFLEGAHIKSPAADTAHENALTAQYVAVHSPSLDRRWTIRESSARIDHVWVMSRIRECNFPTKGD